MEKAQKNKDVKGHITCGDGFQRGCVLIREPTVQRPEECWGHLCLEGPMLSRS